MDPRASAEADVADDDRASVAQWRRAGSRACRAPPAETSENPSGTARALPACMTNTMTDAEWSRMVDQQIARRQAEALAEACEMARNGASEYDCAVWLSAAQDRIAAAPWG